MKLSEAIYRGAQMKGQSFGSLYTIDEKTGNQKSCALGAALDAIEPIALENFAYNDAGKILAWYFPILNEQSLTKFQSIDRNFNKIKDVIVHLNDQLHWSRESIACYVRDEEKMRERDKISEIEKAVNSPDNLIKEQAYTYTS